MSITRDFEKKDGKCCECGSFDSRDVLALLAHARSLEAQNEELKAMLRKHQWNGNPEACAGECPECKYPLPFAGDIDGPHDPDCSLAKLIGE